jgi:hypothetical protein
MGVGSNDGSGVGGKVGASEGSGVGSAEGSAEGRTVGNEVGTAVGFPEFEESGVGTIEGGIVVGLLEGSRDGGTLTVPLPEVAWLAAAPVVLLLLLTSDALLGRGCAKHTSDPGEEPVGPTRTSRTINVPTWLW